MIGARDARPATEEPAPVDPPSLPAIAASGVRLHFGEQPVLRGADLVVPTGARLALLGPNGAGKTTLLRALAGLLRPSAGVVLVGGRSVASDPVALRRSIGLVGHQSYLYPELTVRENLRFYARLYGIRRPDERITAVLEQVGLATRPTDAVASLSRGMVQRLNLARALLHDPPVLLLDEPDAGLDAEAFARLEAILRAGAEPGRTVLLVTHDLEHALRLADRVAILRAGRVVDESAGARLDLPALRERYARATAAPRPTGAPAVGLRPAGQLRIRPARGATPSPAREPLAPAPELGGGLSRPEPPVELPAAPPPAHRRAGEARTPFVEAVAALVWKDLLSEARTKETLGAGIVFALLVLVIFNFAFDLRADNAALVAPGVLWLTFIFAGMLGIGRAFVAERDRGTLDGLLLAPVDRAALYLAKALTNALLMGLVELVALPIFVALFDVRLAWLETALIVALGTVGFAGVGTLVAAIAANTRAREVLLPVLLFPLEVPVVIASVEATALALGARPAEALPWLQLLLGFDVILVASSFLVFEYVIEE